MCPESYRFSQLFSNTQDHVKFKLGFKTSKLTAIFKKAESTNSNLKFGW